MIKIGFLLVNFGVGASITYFVSTGVLLMKKDIKKAAVRFGVAAGLFSFVLFSHIALQ